MKKLYLMLFALAVIVVSGCSTDYEAPAGTTDIAGNDVEGGIDDVVPVVSGDEASRDVIVDRSNYVTPGKELYDTATVNFVQRIGKGFEVVVTTESNIEAPLMTSENCLARTRQEEFTSIKDGQGTEITFSTDEVSEEKRNMCIYLKAVGTSEESEQLQVTTKVEEITFK